MLKKPMSNEKKPAMQASFICIQSVKRIHGKAEIQLSNGSFITMPRCMLKERPYKTGVHFDLASHNEFIQNRAYPFALDKAISMLAIRARTEHELVQALHNCAFSDPVIARVMARIQEAGYINDADFAEHWAAARTAKGLGKMRIRMELRHKGIAQSEIDDALASLDHDAMFDSAIKAAEKAARGRNLSEHAERQKILAALARRGFDFSTAKRALQYILDHDT